MKLPIGLKALDDSRVRPLLARVASTLRESVEHPPSSLVGQVSVAATRRLLTLPPCEGGPAPRASWPPTDNEQLWISFLIEDAFGFPPRGGSAVSLEPCSHGGRGRSITWATANEWNALAQSLFRSGMGAQEVIATMTDMYEPMQPPRLLSRSRALEDLAVWAHLLPAEVYGEQVFSRDKANIERLLGCQHADGLAYPVHGGGACPDFNFASVAAWLLLDANLGYGFRALLADALRRLAEAILQYSSHAQVPVAESFRPGPLGILQRFRLNGAAREWVSPDVFRGRQLGQPCWFSMLMRLVTLEIAGRAIPAGPRNLPGRAELARGVGFNHLSTMLLLLPDD